MKKEIVISNFKLVYDGLYHIKWDNFDLRVFLELKTILKMLEIEGHTIEYVEKQTDECEPLIFSKVKLRVQTWEEDGIIQFYTSDYTDCVQGVVLFAVELI